MRHAAGLLLILALAPAAPAFSAEGGEIVVQKECMVLEGKGIEEVKKELLLAARRSAVEQLFGSLVTSLTQVENLALKKDQIQAASMGYVRFEGQPVFSNGENLGELCVKVGVYATEEDRAKLRAKELSKKICVSEGDVGTIIKRAEDKAIFEVLTNYDGNLRRLSPDKILPLLHEAQFFDRGFVSETTTYCIRVTGLLYPVEAAAATLTFEGKTPESEKVESVAGLKGEYFNAPPFGSREMPTFPDKPEFVRIDKEIDFNWGTGSPAPRVSADYFMVRWTGEIYAPITGTYRFRSDHNDAAQLIIDGRLVFQDWSIQDYAANHQAKNYATPDRPVGLSYDEETVWTFSPESDVYLEGDRWYSIRLEFLEWKDDAFIKLTWRSPGEKELTVIPTSNLRSLK